MDKEASSIFDQIACSRRTVKSFNGKPIEADKLELLLKWAIMAPNHRKNEPWAFRVLQQPKIHELAEKLTSDVKASKIEVLKSLGALIVVSVEQSKKPEVDLENYAAACAATQNILLGAQALGIFSFWNTGKIMRESGTWKFLKIPEAERLVGGIYLGYGDESPKAPERKRSPSRIYWL